MTDTSVYCARIADSEAFFWMLSEANYERYYGHKFPDLDGVPNPYKPKNGLVSGSLVWVIVAVLVVVALVVGGYCCIKKLN